MSTLREQLERIKENTKNRIPPDALRVVDRAREELIRSGIAERALRVGELAPEFTLPDVDGAPVSSAALLTHGPLVVSFYRGKW